MSRVMNSQTLFCFMLKRDASKRFFSTVSLFFVFLLMTVNLFSQNTIDVDSVMQNGNEAYQQENYSEAIQLYQSIINEGNEGSILFYNLGNAYYKSGDLARALLWYERALRLDPNNDDIKHNILFVNNKIIDKIENIPEFVLSKWWNTLSKSMTSRSWAIVSIILAFLLFLLIVIFSMSRRQWLHTLSFILGVLVFITLIVSIAFAEKEKNRYEKAPEAIVMESVVSAKNTPNQSGGDLFVIHSGLKVRVTDKIGEWYEIMLPNGEKGWVQADDIEVI